ncbi:ABC transporter permease [Membranicola marinus]|uniref:ABC transporter permease n=1 Tax=Membranihabitans marinus TaxID=1227546 RepID=A0A953LA20_9BACT|nr:FtsX-like permease family protein [Membranihabitans marinus]MBY5959445.1 ABC transporter permease [Membranihabitans marinus]
MSISTQVAWKYFYKRKKNHFINYISALSVIGLTIGFTVLLLVGSVFNGFEGLLLSMFSQTNPDLYIASERGKTMDITPQQLEEVTALTGVAAAAPVLEETVLFSYDNNNLVASLYGVPENYFSVVDLRPYRSLGALELYMEGEPQLILGTTLKRNLNVVINDPFQPVETFFPRSSGTTFLGQDLLRRQVIYPSGTFSVVQEEGSGHAYAPLDFVRSLIGYPDTVYTGLQIKLADEGAENRVRQSLHHIFNEQKIIIRNNYQQDEDLYKLMNIEKWIGYIIVIFTIILIAFNLVGCIWMIVIEKSDHFRILKAMGAQKKDIRRIIFKLGGFYALTSILTGTGVTLLIYWLHKTFGLLRMGESMIVDSYPSELHGTDFILGISVVILICFLASWPAAIRAVNLSFRQKK